MLPPVPELSPLTKLEMQHKEKRNRSMLILFGKRIVLRVEKRHLLAVAPK